MQPAEPGRVAYVCKMYPRLAETFILNEILAHEQSGLELEVFSLRMPGDGRFHRDLGRVRAQTTYLPGPSVKAEHFWTALGRARKTLPNGHRVFEIADGADAGDLYQAIALAEAVRERGITHIHAHFATAATTVARLASLLAAVPYSFTAHAKDIFHDSVEDADLGRKLRDAAAVVTVSDFNLAYLRDRFGEDADSVQRIYNGLDLDQFSYSPPRGRPRRVIAVGRLVEKKGFADLIDACAILKDRGCEFECEIIGGGVLGKDLDKQVAALGVGDCVAMLGPISRDEVTQHVRRAALMAVPCVVSGNGNRDGMPTVLLETMALGTPCISTAVTGIPEIVRDDETGLITPQNDPASLADAIERLLDDEALGERLAVNARQLVEQEYDIHRNTVSMRELFRTGIPERAPVTLEVV